MSYTDDFYTKKAISLGIRARSYFKLEEIDKKFNCIKKGQTILDLGCSPGSWLEYCDKKTNGVVKLYGVDLQELSPFEKTKVNFIKKSIFDLKTKDIPCQLDVIISDMAPKTTGISNIDSSASARLVESALSLTFAHLKPGGVFIAKYLQGEDFQNLLKKIKKQFKRCKTFKPQSSRSFSTELFFIAFSKKL